VLRRLRLLLPHGAEDGDERDVDEADVLGADAELELAQRLEEDEGLDVADGAADLDEADVGRRRRRAVRARRRAVDDLVRNAVEPVLHGVRHVGDDLHRLAELVAAALRVDDLPEAGWGWGWGEEAKKCRIL
jgi:hypothetical protein